MALIKNIKPHLILGPGDYIKEMIETLNWTQEDLASVLGISLKHLNNIVQNKRPITFESAKLFSKAFGHSTQFWINLDTDYRVKLSEQTKEENDVEIKTMLYKNMPIAEMMRRGWIDKTKEASVLLKNINKFWNNDTIDESFFKKNIESFAFRKSNTFHSFNLNFAISWLQMAKNLSQKISLPTFNRTGLEELAQNINTYTISFNGIEEFLEKLDTLGVKFIYLKHLPKTYLDGAAFLDGDNPVIVYTGRYNRIDNFWFTISHEIGHVLKHLNHKKKEIIDDEKLIDKKSKIEREADDFASLILKHTEIYNYFSHDMNYITRSQILECSKKFDIHRGIIIGALAFKKKTYYRYLHEYTEKVDDKIPFKYKNGLV